jgi:hypothetical protein
VTYSIRELNTHTRKPVYTRKYTAHEGFGEEIKNHFAIGKYKGIFFPSFGSTEHLPNESRTFLKCATV